jgi:CRP-like cAMP-binding protein/Fe-S-cluster-containing hydrogenase component 2
MSDDIRRIQLGEILTADQILQHPLFAGAKKAKVEKNVGAVSLRRLKPGELICREGEEGSTAFYIIEGTIDIFIGSPVAGLDKSSNDRGWFLKMKTALGSFLKRPPVETAERRFIPIDSPVDLPTDNPIRQLGPGDLFGELTCLNLYPRSASARAVTDCTVLEMLRSVLEILLENKDFKLRVEENYRKRTLNTHLASVGMFKGLPIEAINGLRDRAELMTCALGQVICKQGDAADAFYMIRIGHVRISQNLPGGEIVRRYLSRGEYFGEIGLLKNSVRTATCTAVDNVELVRIRREDFIDTIERFPAVRENLESTAERRLESDVKESRRLQSSHLDDFIKQGLMQAQNLLLLDLEKCTRCDDCVRACASAHDGVTRLIREGVRFDNFLVATSCRQCQDPLCMVGCPVGSIHRGDSLEIKIEDWCIGCGLCVRQCPYDNITLHTFGQEADAVTGKMKDIRKATVCDLCAAHPEPSCVYACPHDAAQRVDPQVFFATDTKKQ